MLSKLILHNSDLKRLMDEGYEIEVRGGHLIVHQIPYVNSKCELMTGKLITPLELSGEKTIKPQHHKAQKKYGLRKFILVVIIAISIFIINHIIKSTKAENIKNLSDNIESIDSSNTEDKKIENQLKNIEEKEYPNGDLKF